MFIVLLMMMLFKIILKKIKLVWCMYNVNFIEFIFFFRCYDMCDCYNIEKILIFNEFNILSLLIVNFK